jgi:ParB/RepB/Spo0J family partition protein
MEKENAITILLDAITVSETNETFRRKKNMSEKALQELADSIKAMGVIQPVMVRPDHAKADCYILICGERRYHASRMAGRASIPAVVRDVNTETALILQITENMQRENVHALDEAKGYKMILEQEEKTTPAILAMKFGKSETYIVQRLKLNDLVREARKDFYDEKMNIGHATLLARLTPDAQRQAMERLTRYGNGYGAVEDLKKFIEREVMNDLAHAPFDPLEPNLVKKAGACDVCPKRSGAAPKLFAEIQHKDCCFDQVCFMIKAQKFLINKVREVVETQPNIVFLSTHHEPVEKVLQILAGHEITPLQLHTDFFTEKTGGGKVKGLWICGAKAGQIETVHLKHDEKKAAIERGDVREVVAKIEQRIERAVELDAEKVYAKILDSMTKHSTQKKASTLPMFPEEEAFLWFLVFDKARYELKRELKRTLNLPDKDTEQFYKILCKLKPYQKAFMLRRVMLEEYGGNYPASTYGFIIRKIAECYEDIDIKGFEKEQNEIREKREGRAKDRIKGLKKAGKEKVTA